jgi:hypothetical protein
MSITMSIAIKTVLPLISFYVLLSDPEASGEGHVK